MDKFAQAIATLADTLKRPDMTGEMLRQSLVKVLQLAERADQATRDTLLEQVSELMLTTSLSRASYLAIGCGALVEEGADPLRGLTPLMTRTREALEGAVPFVEACQRAAEASENPPEDAEERVEMFGKHIAEQMPGEAAAFDAVPRLCQAMTAFLSHSIEARRVAHANNELISACKLLPFDPGFVDFLHMLLQVMDNEEMIVLYPKLGCGYRIQISGIGDNFQLHTLLADALIGDPRQGWLPGKRPDPRIVAMAKDAPFTEKDVEKLSAEGRFNLVNWQGLQPDGTLPEGQRSGHVHWIWNEGIPADIAPFEGTRVILLSPPPYSRHWGAGRVFPGMKAHLRVLEILSPETVQQWLRRIASVPR